MTLARLWAAYKLASIAVAGGACGYFAAKFNVWLLKKVRAKIEK